MKRLIHLVFGAIIAAVLIASPSAPQAQAVEFTQILVRFTLPGTFGATDFRFILCDGTLNIGSIIDSEQRIRDSFVDRRFKSCLIRFRGVPLPTSRQRSISYPLTARYQFQQFNAAGNVEFLGNPVNLTLSPSSLAVPFRKNAGRTITYRYTIISGANTATAR